MLEVQSTFGAFAVMSHLYILEFSSIAEELLLNPLLLNTHQQGLFLHVDPRRVDAQGTTTVPAWRRYVPSRQLQHPPPRFT